MLYKKFANATGGEYVDKTTLERYDLLEAELRFYCPIECNCNCGDPESCCFQSDTKEDAITHFNLELYELPEL
jgi:hypothetical protein